MRFDIVGRLVQHGTDLFSVMMSAAAWLALCNLVVLTFVLHHSTLSWVEEGLAATTQIMLFGSAGAVFAALFTVLFATFSALLKTETHRGIFSGGSFLRNIAFGDATPHAPETIGVLVALAVCFVLSAQSFEIFVFVPTDRPKEIAVLVGSVLLALPIFAAHRIWAWRTQRRCHALVVMLGLVAYLFYLVPTAFNPIGYTQVTLPVAWLGAALGFAMIEDSWLEKLHHTKHTRLGVLVCAALFAIASVWSAFAYEKYPALHTELVAPDAGLHQAALSWVRDRWDLDGDSFAPWLMGGDCDDFNSDIHPAQIELPGNGIDDNCRGGDLAADKANPNPLHFAPVAWKNPDAQRPNLLLVTVDTLRADHIGLTIKGRPLTPTLDSLAAQGHLFENAYASSSHTSESLPSLLMGRYPSDWHEGTVGFGFDRSLPEILTTLGYETTAFLSVPYAEPLIAMGFQEVDNRLGGLDKDQDKQLAPITTRLALDRILSKEPKRPFFIWIHYFDPHAWYLHNPELVDWLGDSVQDTYKHEIVAVDNTINMLLGTLQHKGLLENTALVFTSDHGESFGEHGVHGHHKHLYEGIVRVPLFINLPGLGKGKRHTAPIAGVDIFPTLIDYLGIEGTHTRPGMSLLPLMRGQPMPKRPIFVELDDSGIRMQSLILKPWKLIHDQRTNASYLFHLDKDPLEEKNLVSEEQETLAQLQAILAQWHDGLFNTVRFQDKVRHAPTRGLKISPNTQGIDLKCHRLSKDFRQCRTL